MKLFLRCNLQVKMNLIYLSKRVENLENKIKKLETKKRKNTKQAKRS